jgi:hypothetical protein
MLYKGEFNLFQRLPGRFIASKPITCTALARLILPSGFLAEALQALRADAYAGKLHFFPSGFLADASQAI